MLLNARKHQTSAAAGDRRPALPAGFIDSCSSAPWFDNFARPGELAFGAARARAEWRATSGIEAPVVPAQTWLLRQRSRSPGAFDIDDVPGAD